MGNIPSGAGVEAGSLTGESEAVPNTSNAGPEPQARPRRMSPRWVRKAKES